MAIKRISAAMLCLFLMITGLQAQDDPVLFTVEDNPVHVSEFKYIYAKTNAEKADFSKTSINEYLELYTKFKLKVAAAKGMKLDTIPALKNELAGYHRQLSNSYLIEKELTEKLIREAYDRTQEEVNISHILVSLPKTASPQDTLAAYKKAMAIKKELDEGADFVATVKAKSDDVSSKDYGGEIGYFKGMQLPNLYSLESVAYNTPVGKIGGPVRTSLGYHIVKVNGRQPARGEINAGHILVRVANKSKEAEAAAKAKIDGIYQELKAGGNFTEIAKVKSDDKKTAAKGGELGFFGINVYEPSIENAAFSLQQNGDYSEPVRSSLGWHILMRFEKKEELSYEMAKPALTNKVKKDSRYKITRQVMIERIKKENNFKENAATLNTFARGLDKDFFTADWKGPKEAKDKLFTIGKQEVVLKDFIEYLTVNRNLRLRRSRGNTPENVALDLYGDFVTDKVIKYEESQLGEKYPEFKSLMREYEEGILLFEATKRKVWDKAGADSVGLEAFFKRNEDKYLWGERARVSIYTVNINDEKVVAKARKLAAKKSANSLLAKINKTQDFLSVREEKYEKGRNLQVDSMNWTAGDVSEVYQDRGKVTFMKIEEIIAPGSKTLKDARGYVVADYQDHLEKIWVQELKNKYTVVVDQKVLSQLIR